MEILKKNKLNMFTLIMMAVVSVDSLRNLPISAQYGFSLITFYLFAGCTFFLPLAWIAAQLTIRYPNVGGSYVWIETAFGKHFGYLSIWLQWLYNIIWYPTIFAFIASTIAHLIYPAFEKNHLFIFMTSIILFWSITFIHAYGMRATSLISIIGAIIGTLLPMLLIIGLAIYWVLSGEKMATAFHLQTLWPDKMDFNNLAYFSNILFSLIGIEVISMHAGNVTQAEKIYPRSFMMSAIIILTTLMLASVAMCMIIPAEKIGLLTGIMDVFALFFSKQAFPLGATILGWCIVIGGLGIASSWMIGIARGLHVSLCTAPVPNFLKKLNQNEVPLNILYLQAIIYSLLLGYFLILSDVDSSYWLLSALSAQFSLLYYLLLFAAAFKLLRASQKSFLNTSLPISAGLTSLLGIMIGFLTPLNINKNNFLQYGFVFIISALMIFCWFSFRKKKELTKPV